MKIVIATPLYPPELGGPATYAKILFEELPKQGIEVELVKFGDVRHLPKIVRHIAYFLRVRRALARADVALALDPVSVGLPTCVAAWTLRKPFVVKVVGDYAWEQGRQRFGIKDTLDDFTRTKRAPFFVRFLRSVQTRVARRAHTIIVPGEYLKKIVFAWGVPKEKIHVVHNAISLEKTGSVPSQVERLYRPLVVCAGRLVPWKNMDKVIDAVASLHKKGIKTSLVVVGDGPERATLASHAEKKLGSACVFTGAQSHADMLAILKYTDVFVLNSSYEGLSHMLIEAQTLGVPTVATKVGGNTEIITDNENGLLVPYGDFDALPFAISRILSDKSLKSRLSASAKASSSRFSINVMLDGIVSVLDEFK
ncbi:hypothetical protein MNBD_CPR01-311 [hydrothermal vent metagenome]|uniref:Glycosyltransferase n=1 Tax=hydrothermal vent metagenome TaxID=652676 RepID=A0A3B0UWI6_9ZZZZ